MIKCQRNSSKGALRAILRIYSYQVYSDLIKLKTTPKCSWITDRLTNSVKCKIFLAILVRGYSVLMANKDTSSLFIMFLAAKIFNIVNAHVRIYYPAPTSIWRQWFEFFTWYLPSNSYQCYSLMTVLFFQFLVVSNPLDNKCNIFPNY